MHSARTLQRIFQSITGKRIPVVATPSGKKGLSAIFLGQPEDNSILCNLLSRSGLHLNTSNQIDRLTSMKNGEQGFAIRFVNIEECACAVLAGNTPVGTFYAVQEFADRVYKTNDGIYAIDRDNILTSPAIKYRSMFGNVSGPDYVSSGEFIKTFGNNDGTIDVEAFIDWVARYRVNNLLITLFDLQFGINYASKKYPEAVNIKHPNVKNEFFGQLVEKAKESHIDVWLTSNFPDCWFGVIKAYPKFAAKHVDMQAYDRTDDWWDKFYTGMTRREYALLRPSSVVCANEPAVMEFWRGYWEELLQRYPGVAGVGGQWGEKPKQRCYCSKCKENFDEQQWRYFKVMTEVAEKVHPGLKYWMWYALYGREIAKHRDKLPNLTYIYFGDGAIRPPVSEAQGTKVDWYLSHGMTDPNYEPWLRRHCLECQRLGIVGIQKRLAEYHKCDRSYYALARFSWSPELSWEEFARQYILHKYHMKDTQKVKTYAAILRDRSEQIAISQGDK